MVDLHPNKPSTPHPMVIAWGKSIRERRELLKWKQGFLAVQTSIPQQTISKIENGRFTPSLPMLLDIARGLCIDPGDLYRWPSLRELAA